MEKETALRNAVTLAASGLGVRLFRNNVGLGWVGRLIGGVKAGRVTLAEARPLHAGLCKGSHDLIGLRPVVVTPEMVGRTVAVFVSIELKTGDVTVTTEQEDFGAMVQGCGGIVGVARSVDDALAILTKEPGVAAGL